MGEPGELDDELAGRVSALYELDPDEFVAAREAAAKALRLEKRREDARLIHSLAKPTVVAWAAGRAAVAQPGLLDRLVEAGAALVDAERRAVEDGDASALRPAQAERRAAGAALADAAEAVLERRERSTAVRRDELSALFDVVSLDPDAAAELRAGRLARTPDGPSAFDPFSGAATPAASRPAQPGGARRRQPPTGAARGRGSAAKSAKTDKTDKTDEEAEALAAEVRREADEAVAAAQAAHDEAVRRADAAYQRRDESAAALSDASRAVQDAEAQLARARDELERATEEVSRAEGEAGDADALVDQAAAARDRAEQAREAVG